MQPSFVRNAKFARTPVQAVFGVQEPHTYHGSFTFISELYTGSISDCELAIQSGILPLFDTVPSGRQVIADRGFDIQDLPVKPKLLLNIPAFKGSRTFSLFLKLCKLRRLQVCVSTWRKQSEESSENYAEVAYSRAWNFVRTRLSLAILHASAHCLREASGSSSCSRVSAEQPLPSFLRPPIFLLIFHSLFSSLLQHTFAGTGHL